MDYKNLPRVAVLLATHNGEPWLEEQVRSILAQTGVRVTIFVSDDLSRDATLDLLDAMIAAGHPIQLLPVAPKGFGNASRNFMRLVNDAPVGDHDYVALADQDDIWLPEKLSHAIAVLQQHKADAYSADVLAFWPDGREKLIVKSKPQQPHDYLFESAGPGCTFVIRRERFAALRAFALANRAGIFHAKVHDWLIYAFARVNGWRWIIDTRPLMRYRQHASNEVGVNSGRKAIAKRFDAIRSGAFRRDVLLMGRLSGDRSWVMQRLERFGLVDRFKLAAGARQCRRQGKEALLLAAFFFLMPK